MFDWQTDEDEVVWEEEVQTPLEVPKQSRIKWWFVALPILLLGGGFYLYQQIQTQTDTAVSTVEEDIISSHTLLLEAVENKDRDVFELLLSGRDMAWVHAYDSLVEVGQFLDYAPFGLIYQPDSYEVVNIELTPAFDSATVEFSLGYLNDDNENIRLKQTAVFRPGDTRWLFAPPDSEYWGEWQTLEEDEFTFIYTAQDADWVESFAVEMSQWLPTLCDELGQASCDQWGKIIRFDNTPDIRFQYLNEDVRYESGPQIELPSPALIGYPTDDESALFLSDIYKEMISRVYIAEMLSYKCCVNVMLVDQLMTRYLADLGLTSWSINPQMHYDRFQMEEPPNLTQLEAYWGVERMPPLSVDELAELHLMLDFITELNSDLTAVDVLQSLIDAKFTVGHWLNFILYGASATELRDRNSLSEANRLWEQYALLHEEVETALPATMPDETITLACNPRDLLAESTQLYQYHFASESWQKIHDQKDFSMLYPLPDNANVLFQNLIFGELETPMSEIGLWNSDGFQMIKSAEEEYAISLGQVSRNGRFVAAYAFGTGEQAVNTGPRTFIYDLDNCTNEECSPVLGVGYPVWSPDEEHILFLPFDNFNFVTQVADGRIWHAGDRSPFNVYLGLGIQPAPSEIEPDTFITDIVGFGYAPVWLNNQTFGYIETNVDRSESVFKIHSIENLDRVNTLFSSTDIQQVIPNNNRNPQLSYVIPMPNNETQLMVVLSGRGSTGHLVLHDLETEESTYIMQVTNSFQHLLAISPNGRYIAAATSLDDQLQGRNATIYDLETGEIKTAFLKTTNFFLGLSMDWSSDGEWIAIATDHDILQLFHMPTGQKYLLSHPHGSCDSVSWLDQLSQN